MAVRRSLLVCFFVILILFLPGMLYLVDGGYIGPLGNIIGGDGSREESSIDENEEDPINYFSFIKAPDKHEIIAAKQEEWLQREKEREAAAQAEAASEAARAAESRTAGSSTSINQKEQQMLSFVNEERIQAGLPSLTYCSQLTSAARAKSRDMIDNNYFSHTSPRYGGLSG